MQGAAEWCVAPRDGGFDCCEDCRAGCRSSVFSVDATEDYAREERGKGKRKGKRMEKAGNTKIVLSSSWLRTILRSMHVYTSSFPHRGSRGGQ